MTLAEECEFNAARLRLEAKALVSFNDLDGAEIWERRAAVFDRAAELARDQERVVKNDAKD